MLSTTYIDFQSLFESAPGLYLILNPDFTIVAVSDSYLDATMTKREEIIGRDLFEVFPDNPGDPHATGVFNLRASLNHVLLHGETHVMAVQKYDIRRPDGTFEERFWSPLNKPVLNQQHEVQWIIHRVEDVTDLVLMKKEEARQAQVTEGLRRQVDEMSIEIFKKYEELRANHERLQEEIAEREKLETQLKMFNESLEEQVSQNTAAILETSKRLSESEEKYRTIFYKSPLPKWIYDINTLQFLEVNEMAVLHYGYSSAEFLKMTITDIRPPEDIPEVLEDIKAVSSGTTKRFGTWRHRKKNGTIIIVETTAHDLLYDGRRARLVVARDITEMIHAEEQLAAERNLLRSLIDHLPDFIYVKDKDFHYVIANKAMIEFAGARDESAILGKTVAELFGNEIARANFEEDQKVFQTGAFTLNREELVPDASGNAHWLLTSKVPLKNELHDITGLIGISRDITDRKHTQLLLQQMNDSLEKRAAELKTSNNELERFAYVASHDLQEPLRMVRSFLNLLEEKLEGKLDETGKQYLHFVLDGAERMKLLIQSLLEYSRIGNNKEKFTATDLNEEMQYIIRLLDENIKKSRAVITISPMPVITANKALLHLLFTNLISNALKYHGEKDPVIEVGCTEQSDEYTFYVKDNGIGIDPKYFEKIFIIFQRLHNKSEYPGTGIGLAICKKIVEIHQGKIWVNSRSGEGSTFYFTIPKTGK